MKNKIICSVLHLTEAARLIELTNPELSLTLLKTAKFLIESHNIEDVELNNSKEIINNIKTVNDTNNNEA